MWPCLVVQGQNWVQGGMLSPLVSTRVSLLCHIVRRDKAGDSGHPGDMTDFEVDKLIVVTSAKKGAKGQQLDQQLINDGLALYQEQLSDVSW